MMGAVLQTVNVRLVAGADPLHAQPCRRRRRCWSMPSSCRCSKRSSDRLRDGRDIRAADRRRAGRRAGRFRWRRIRGAAGRRSGRLRVPRFRREHARHDLLHHRHHRPAEGRLFQPSPARAAHACAASAVLAWRRARAALHRDDVYMPITPMFHVHAWGFPYAATMAGRQAGLSRPLRARRACSS